MKANEAPEKIYLTTFGFPICEPIPQDSSNPDTVWSEKPYEGADSVEYTRTDAFIEKACSGIEKLLSGYIIRNFHFGDSYKIDRLIEDFRNYMKGE